MTQVDPEVERILNRTLEQLKKHDYRRGRLSQGLFLLALDLREYSNNHPQYEYSWLDDALEDAMTQHEWARSFLEDADLPKGFASSAADGKVDLIEFDDPRVDHEWLLEPGDSFFEAIVSQYYPIICGDWSIQQASEMTRKDRWGVKNIAILLIAEINPASSLLVPIIAVFVLRLVEEGIDDVCDEYEPY